METATLEQPVKIRKPRTKKPVFPHVEAARKAMSKALKLELPWRNIRDRNAKNLREAEAKLTEIAQDTTAAWEALIEAAKGAAQASTTRHTPTA